ncbi:MAG: hypothetical protein HW403_489 [Dehalococcoidia bacterium]|nr:hypothetical protein [Dehalococcoidia bacterium]
MDKEARIARSNKLSILWRGGQEGWYLLAALFGVGGVLIAAGGLAPTFGLLTLLLSSVCFGIGVLMHSVPQEPDG